ncbi:MAG: S8 family serine peptidase [Deltaproteobacteria bacterium]|nr:S8 family serine peptidase [Deltaproteobacteria bacterium]
MRVSKKWIPWRTILGLWIFGLGILGAVDGIAQSAENTSHHTVIVFLKADQVEESPAAFVERLNVGTEKDVAALSPSSAEEMVPMSPLPNGLEPLPGSPRYLLSRYVTLYYPIDRDIDKILEELKNDGRFGYVGRDTEGGFSAVPGDAFYRDLLDPTNPETQQWAYQQVGLEAAWDYTKGYATVGVADTGIEPGHPDLQQNFRGHQSWNFDRGVANPDEDEEEDEDAFVGHGTFVAGLLAASSDNGTGVTGSCWNCSLMVARARMSSRRERAFEWLADNGAQVVNLSGFFGGPSDGSLPAGTPCESLPPSDRHYFCAVLDILEAREIVFTVASGNDLRRINFPANEPTTVAVGGTERSGEIWNDQGGLTPCEGFTANSSFGPFFQCGSNFGPEQDFVAPAKQTLSTFYTGRHWGLGVIGCSDDPNESNTFDPTGSTPTLGYDYCTGTSMSAPLVAGVFAQLKSVNPLLTVTAAKQALIETASQSGVHDDLFGYGIPNAAAAVEHVLGTVGGKQIRTRMTPMFSLFGTARANELYKSPKPNYLYTSKPQVASGAVKGRLHESPANTNTLPYGSTNAGSPVMDFSSFPLEPSIPSPVPASSFYVFTTEHNPFDPATPMVPLYRLSFAEECDPRDFVYTTEQAGIDYFTGASGQVPDWCPNQSGEQVFRLDGIEGYIFPECPPGFSCNDSSDPSQPQCLHRRWSSVDGHYALVLERERGLPPYQTYTRTSGNSCIGYVFPNDDSDSDGLIDGFELVLGTDPLNADSDSDSIPDGSEYPLGGLPVSDPLHNPNCDSIFADSFDNGDTSAWNRAVTAGSGQLGVDTASAIVGPFGMFVQISSVGDQGWVHDYSPASESFYRARFQFRLADITMPYRQPHYLFVALDNDPNHLVFSVDMWRTASSYQMRARTKPNSGAIVKTEWISFASVSDPPADHQVELVWTKADSGQSNGSLALSVNDVRRQIIDLDNDSRQIDEIRLGILAGRNADTEGLFMFDEFESCRN